jgi:hypothetical protein
MSGCMEYLENSLMWSKPPEMLASAVSSGFQINKIYVELNGI